MLMMNLPGSCELLQEKSWSLLATELRNLCLEVDWSPGENQISYEEMEHRIRLRYGEVGSQDSGLSRDKLSLTDRSNLTGSNKCILT